jgi:lipoprotein-anchoring transpeptidase ErfK/SrfK
MNRDVLERLRANPAARAPSRDLPTAPMHRKRARRKNLLPLFFLPAFLCLLVAAAWSAATSPVLASFLPLNASPAPTQAASRRWAQAVLAKPAYTPTTMPTAAATQPAGTQPAEVLPADAPAVDTPAPLILAQIVQDTPSVPGQGDANVQDTAPPASYTGDKYILVDISEQHLYAYQGGQLVYSFIASTGMNNATRIGTFAIQSKIPNAYGSTWDIWMPNWMGIYWSGGLENGIHALPILPNGSLLWSGFLGRPISYGCVVLDTYDSQLLYDWAEYGTPVEIQW